MQFVIHQAPGQELELELYDEDTDKDDFLGKYNLDFGEVRREKERSVVYSGGDPEWRSSSQAPVAFPSNGLQPAKGVCR